MTGGLRRLALAIAVAALATLMTSAVPNEETVVHRGIMGCESGCVVAAAGWPLPWIVDYPAISPVGSVSLAEALLGVDRIRKSGLAADFLFWLFPAALLAWLAGLRRRR